MLSLPARCGLQMEVFAMLNITMLIGGVMAAMVALAGSAEAGTLTGRIIRDNGASLSGSSLTIQGVAVTTNQFGGYEVQLPDGEYELTVTVDGQPYRTDPIRIYSPQTKQNWRLNPNAKRLEKIF